MAVFPDSSAPGAEIHPGAIHGSVFGGHFPIVAAHVYVLEAGQTGYASAAVSKLTTGDGTDANGTYALTDSSGAFNITDDYSCDVGHPVYLAATGGSSTANTTIAITSASFTETGNSGKYTVTFAAVNTLTVGQSITLSSLTGGYSQLNGTVQDVTAATSSSFTIMFDGGHGSLSGTTTGTATFGVSSAVAIMAVLGLCPGTTGEFANTLSYVYVNEVSTVAAAYALAPFGSGPFNVGASSTNLLGIQNATVNAGQLYDVQGSNLSSTQDGEGHIARQHTPAPIGYTSNGNVPQALLDTLGNILASCVDSTGATSSQCTTLFTYATSNGRTSGTQPTDTATAAFNIAHYPAGVGASSANFMSKLYGLQVSLVPYTPDLTAQPNDFSVAIQYPSSLNANMGNPESIAVDASGNVFFSNQSTGYITKLLPTGFPSFTYNSGVTPGYLSIDPSGNVWFGAIGGSTPIDELSNTGTLTAHSASIFSTVSAGATDSAGDFYFISSSPAFNTYEFTSTFGSAPSSPFPASTTCVPSGDTYDHLAIDASQQLWVSDEHGGVVCRYTATGGAVKNFPVSVGSGNYPEAIGIDSNAAAWVSLENADEVDQITIHNGNGAVNVNTLTSGGTGGTFNRPFSATIDGLDNVWVTNRGSNSLTELTNAGTAVSPSTNYQPVGAALSDPLNAAIDGSGDIWITNYAGQEVVEMIGAAAPVVTPLSYASGSAAGLGVRP
jgi:streptogramin lyase